MIRTAGMHQAFVGIGANLDDPEASVRRAIEALSALPVTRLVACSSLYRTTPVGYLAQPDFVNAVAEIQTRVPPEPLLEQLLMIEQLFGRKRRWPNAPRTLDLDLLLYSDYQMQSEKLTLPHPRIAERAFVLVPLVEIAPEVAIAGVGTAAQLLLKVSTDGVTRIGRFGDARRSDRV